MHAVRLTADLQLSREGLVTAREEERRRLRRDLHDGLGPALAGMAMKLDAARTRRRSGLEQLLGELRAETQDAIADIRRVVYELRPPALDELGLVGALREQAARLSGVEAAAPVARRAGRRPGDAPPLPAAVEVAAYRIATEALTNVARHAGASRCTVRLALDGGLSSRSPTMAAACGGRAPGSGLLRCASARTSSAEAAGRQARRRRHGGEGRLPLEGS